MRIRKPDSSGFTLLELIIVLFLISLIMSLAAVFYANTLPSSRFNATAREMTATLRHARNLAQGSGNRIDVTIDLDSGKYWIEGRSEKTIPPDITVLVTDPVAGEVSMGQHHMVFFPSGNADGGTLVLKNAKSVVSIKLDPIIGAFIRK